MILVSEINIRQISAYMLGRKLFPSISEEKWLYLYAFQKGEVLGHVLFQFKHGLSSQAIKQVEYWIKDEREPYW